VVVVVGVVGVWGGVGWGGVGGGSGPSCVFIVAQRSALGAWLRRMSRACMLTLVSIVAQHPANGCAWCPSRALVMNQLRLAHSYLVP
jgi:hypothetical protein